MPADDIRTMIADYMDRGFLENIVDMFRHDRSLSPLIADLMRDERMRVRLGISALVETLAEEDRASITNAIPGIVDLLRNENPTIRGDAAYLLGIIGHREVIPFLTQAADDDNPGVRQIVREAIEEIKAKEKSDEEG